QGTLEYEVETGLLGTSAYISTFASNVDLEGDTDTAHIEIDAYFGLRGEFWDSGVSWDIGGAYYAYPDARASDNFDYWEIPVVLTWHPTEWLQLEAYNFATWEYQFNAGAANYTLGIVTVDIPVRWVGWSVFAGVGYQYIEKDASGTDWQLGTTVTIKGVDFTIAYTDTNYDASACGGNNQCDAKAVFTVGAAF
ncbi:MAG TPA: TorF family putative porin, partial [Rhodospirillales bacterium]|nr:TorF family putative porin [Rhodospirillales bacterium]